MSRYALSMRLWDVEISSNGEGNPVEEAVNEADVFANRRTIGSRTYMAGRSAGLHPDAEVELRSCDYAGQCRAEIDGLEYEVETVRDTGEFTRLTLRRRLSND